MTRFATLLVLLLGAAPAAFAQLDVNWDPGSNTLTIGGTDGTDIVQGECTGGGVVTLSGQPTPAPCLDVETIEADLGDGDDGLILTGFGEFVALKKLDVDLGAGDDFGAATGPLTFQAELTYTIDLGPGTDTWSFEDPILDDGTVTVEVDSGESGETEDEVTTVFGGEPELWLVAPDGPLVILDDPDGEARVEFHFPDPGMMPPGLTFNEGAADGALYGDDLSGATMLPHELSFTPGSSGGTVDLDETVLPEGTDTQIRIILGLDGGEIWTTPYGDFIVVEYGASGVITLPADPVIEAGAWLYLLGDDASLETVLHVLLDYLTPSAPGGRASLRGDDHLDVVWLNSGGGLSIYNYPGLDQLDVTLGEQGSEVYLEDLGGLGVERVRFLGDGPDAILRHQGSEGDDDMRAYANRELHTNGAVFELGSIDALYLSGAPSFFTGSDDGDDAFQTVGYADIEQFIDGGSGSDALTVDRYDADANDDGSMVVVEGALPIHYDDVETVTIISTVANEPEAPSDAYRLALYPNPVRAQAQAELTVTQPQAVSAVVYDVLGRQVGVLHDGPLTAGRVAALPLAGLGLPAGVYVLRVQGETFRAARSFTVVR